MPKLDTSKTKWDFSTMYSGDSDPKIDTDKEKVKKACYTFINKWKDNQDYLKDPEVLKQALDEYEELNRNYGSTGAYGYYFWLRKSQDETDPKLKAEMNKIEDDATKIANDIQFFAHQLSKVSLKTQKEFLNNTELKDYHFYLEGLFKFAKHLLSEPEEKILRLKGPVSYSNWVKMVTSLLSKEERDITNEEGKKETKTLEECLSLLSSKNKKARDSAAEAVHDVLSKNVDVAENELNSILQDKKIDDELRGYERPDTERHLGDNVDTAIVDALVSSVTENFDLARRFYELKAKLLKLEKLAYHERNLEYGEVDKKYTYEEGVALVDKVLEELDSDFSTIYRMFVQNGHIDVYPAKGKRGGAFCADDLITLPTYILLNHTNRLNDVTTIAHEVGHGIHNELQRPNVNALNYGVSLATAEVASTFMEDFVLQEILKTADDETKLSILMTKLNDSISSVHRQIACYNFEFELHTEFRKQGYLSKEDIGTLFDKNMGAYMGDFVERPEPSKNWWVYWGHIRRPFYVYSYASGLIISNALQNMVKQDKKNIEKVKQFMRMGASDSPKNIFLSAGIDITDKEFWNRGLKEIGLLLDETEQLAKKLGRI